MSAQHGFHQCSLPVSPAADTLFGSALISDEYISAVGLAGAPSKCVLLSPDAEMRRCMCDRDISVEGGALEG